MPRLIKRIREDAATRIEVSALEFVKPYDDRSTILELRRRGVLTRDEAKARWQTAITLILTDTMTHKVLSRGASNGTTRTKAPTASSPNPTHPTLTTGQDVVIKNIIAVTRAGRNDGWQDVAQEALLRTLEKRGTLDESFVPLAITNAALDLDRDMHGITQMPNTVRDYRQIKTVDLDDAEDIIGPDGALTPEDDELNETRIYALMTPNEKAIVEKRMTGESLEAKERVALQRMRDRWTKAGIDGINGLKKLIARQRQQEIENEAAIEATRTQLPTRFEPDEQRQVIRRVTRPSLPNVTITNPSAPLADLKNPQRRYENAQAKADFGYGAIITRPTPGQRKLRPETRIDEDYEYQTPSDWSLRNLELEEAAGRDKADLKPQVDQVRHYRVNSKGQRINLGTLSTA